MGKPIDWKRLLDITGGVTPVKDYTPTPEELERTGQALEKLQRGVLERKSKLREAEQEKPQK